MQIPNLLFLYNLSAKAYVSGSDSETGVNFGRTEAVRAFLSCINKYRETVIVTLDLGNIAVHHVISCLFQMLVTGH